jgi:SAM-dependent methyltransferase
VIERNQEFDPLAATYNRCWGAEYHSEAFPVVELLLLSAIDPGAHLLDVCCGTGQFTKRVRDAGFQVTGIDASEEMLRYARENLPDSSFLVADAREFSLGRRFAGAYSVFESLNHVPDLEGLAKAFMCVRLHLEPGARFVFDLNGEEAFIRFWNDTSAIVENDRVCVLRSEYDADSRLAQCRITLFEQHGPWERRDFTLRQTCHRKDAVCGALDSAGFTNVTLYDAEDAGMSEHSGYHRTFFLAQAG